MNLTWADIGLELPRDRVVLISGASGGIGRACVKLLARIGANTVAMARDAGKLESLARESVSEHGTAPRLVRGDVRREEDCQRAVDQCLQHFGRIDVLINNAGVGTAVNLTECSTAAYRQTMETNVDGVFFLTRMALAPMLVQKSGHIIMISSNAGTGGNAVAPIYAASKHAVEGLTASLRFQLEQGSGVGRKINISNVWPGTVDSGYWQGRAVQPKSFMTCEEMAAFVVRVIAQTAPFHVSHLRVQHARYESDNRAEREKGVTNA